MQSTAPRYRTVLRGTVPTGFRWGVALVLVALTLACAAVITIPAQKDAIGPPGMLIGVGAVGILLVRSSRHMDGRDRRAWRLIGMGFLVVGVGILTIAILDVAFGPIPAFGPPDIIVIAGYALVLAGFGSLPHLSTSKPQRVRIYLDSAIGAISLAVVMWVLFLDELIAAFAQANAWERWAGSIYPILDVAALMVVVIVTVRRSSYRFDLRLMLFGVGIVVQSLADLTLLKSGFGQTFGEAEPNYVMFLLAALAYVAAASNANRQPKPRAYADRRASLISMVAPYSAAGILVIVLIIEMQASQLTTNARIVLYATLSVGVLVIIRQGVAIGENRQLVERQRAELVSSISHELRTPLTAIVGFLDVMTDEEAGIDEAETRELTEVIHEQARHMSQIVSDLILLARGSPDELTLKESLVSIADLVKGAVRSVEQKTTSLTIEVETHLQGSLDAGRVQQVIVNLLTNAVRYGGDRSLIVVKREGTDLAIEVHDNGPGVPKKFELAIWERFERGPNRFNASTPGSGIGLAVVDAITRAHHGSTAYRQSERLGGACFRVVLPNRVKAA
ncbi:MAG: HAMP domain-containing histidine kinase [Acidimicrobiia bacterium]|nr:HAMP domain-containing histidine kinase [Acidimicrobiia bacterium]MDH3397543.1 HAMP domain-containing histidine kinase [Acidimicrobiia bacterium]